MSSSPRHSNTGGGQCPGRRETSPLCGVAAAGTPLVDPPRQSSTSTPSSPSPDSAHNTPTTQHSKHTNSCLCGRAWTSNRNPASVERQFWINDQDSRSRGLSKEGGCKESYADDRYILPIAWLHEPDLKFCKPKTLYPGNSQI